MAALLFFGVRKRLRGDLARALARTFIARGLSACGAFALVVVLGRLYGTRGVGVYALAISVVMGAGVFGRWGMDNALVRFVGRDVKSTKVRSFLAYACRKAVSISLVALALVCALHGELAVVFRSPLLDKVMWGMAAAIPAYVLAYVLSGFLAAIRKPATACLLQNGVISFITAVIVLIVHFIRPSFGLWVLGWAYAAATWITLVWGGAAVWRSLRAQNISSAQLSASDIVDFRRSSSAFLATDVASFLMGIVGVWIAGYVLSTSDVGLYKAGLQLANTIGMILMVINLVIPARFSYLYNHGDIVALGRLARRSASIGLTLAVLPLMACLFFPRPILGIMGSDFAGAAVVLQMLVIGQLFNVGCGSVGHVLNMAGQERMSSRIVWVANIIGLSILILGTYGIGIIGTALGVVSAQILRKALGVYYAWRYVGVWVLPMPNLLQLMRVPGGSFLSQNHTAR